jgi:hypothetical protein
MNEVTLFIKFTKLSTFKLTTELLFFPGRRDEPRSVNVVWQITGGGSLISGDSGGDSTNNSSGFYVAKFHRLTI